jgi:glycosyltransferase involved in cell wall biosynthesis
MFAAEGVIGKTVFTGMLTGWDKLAALARADLFVLPSYSEGFSIAVLEALTCRLSVVITHQCYFPEVAEADAGIVLEPDIAQLVEALDKLLNDYDMRCKMGENGHRLILEKFTWDKIVDQMIRLYEEVLKSQK